MATYTLALNVENVASRLIKMELYYGAWIFARTLAPGYRVGIPTRQI